MKKKKAPAVHSTAQLIPVKALKPNSWNPNVMDDSMLTSLMYGIRTDGFMGAVLVQKGTNVIIDGEHRWIAARKLGMKKVPVIYLAVSDVKAKELTISLNSKRGYFDDAKLETLVQDIAEVTEASRAELTLALGFTGSEIDAMLHDAQTEAEQELADVMEDEEPAGGGGGSGKDQPDLEDEEEFEEEEEEAEPPEAIAEEGESPNYKPEYPEEKPPKDGKVPMTFYAPSKEEYARMEVLFGTGKKGSFDFAELQKIVKGYHKAYPGKAKAYKKKIAALG